ncbi:hypothetical protein [Longitalea arenae]|uniref:hypothetical protein n=1 Tax=Longitalea arenae TaxID=2812558 RepID=UPI00196743EE|nr:hypothetical protein [Longitalea arenae]
MIERLTSLFKNYLWEFHCWSTQVPMDTSLEEIKRQLPAYISVDWQRPEQFGQGLLYPVTRIKGHRMKRRQYIGFVEGAYCGCTLMS